jgi:tetratricopeptide (TPR) repeat protein
MERRAGTETERIAEDLAHHFREAGELEKAAGYGIQAARRAQAAYANESAQLWYNRTLEMLDQLSPDQASQFQSLRVAAHASLGKVLAMLGQYDESLARYASARALLEAETRSVDQTRQLADLCRQTAEVFERQSEYSLAFEWLEKGLRYLDQDKPTIEKARLYLLEAGVLYRQGKDDQAIDWCQRSLDIASQVKTREGQQVIGRVLYLLGLICTRRGDLRYAVQLCRQSVSVYQQINDCVGQANAYNNLGSAYYEQGDWEQASEADYKSLTIRQEIGDIYGQGMSANNLANIYLGRGEWNQAASLYEQSRAIWEHIGAPGGEALTLSNLAQVHLYQKNWDDARTCLSRSEALFAEVGFQEYQPELERRWGELFLKTGKLDEALEHTRRSIELAIEQSTPLEEGMSRRMLGQVHLARNEWELAGAALRHSLQILDGLNEYEAAKTKLSLASLKMETSPTTDEARAYLAQAINTFEKLGAKADLTEAQALGMNLSNL